MLRIGHARRSYLVIVSDVQPGIVGDHVVVNGQYGLRVRLDPGHLGQRQLVSDIVQSILYSVQCTVYCT
jgi:hypothetical protein